MKRFDELAPAHTTQGSSAMRGTISGEDAFRLYDTFGFPIDLTELMARERGYTVDIAGFETALDAQREQSQEERKSKKISVAADELADATGWSVQLRGTAGTSAVVTGDLTSKVEWPDTSSSATTRWRSRRQVTAVRQVGEGRVAVLLRETPFYAESGGQVSDGGEIVGEGWRVDVDEVRKVDGRIAAIGKLTGAVTFGPAVARVPSDRRKRHRAESHRDAPAARGAARGAGRCACIRQVRSSRPIACASTSPITGR